MDHQVTYAYSATDGRLESVSSGADTFDYDYQPNSANLLSTVTGPAHTVTNIWEADRNVLATKTNALDASTVSSFSYNVNKIGQRTFVTTTGTAFSGGARDRYWGHDNLGQLVSESDANDASFHPSVHSTVDQLIKNQTIYYQ